MMVLVCSHHSAPPIGASCAASDRVWECVRRLLGGAFDTFDSSTAAANESYLILPNL